MDGSSRSPTGPLLLALVAAGLAMSCSTSPGPYGYSSDERPRAEGLRFAIETVPKDAPYDKSQGELLINSGGVVDLELEEGKPPVRALHVMMRLNNNEGETWIFDVRDQKLILPDGTSLSPDHAHALVLGLPEVLVLPAETKTFDLFYTLPAAFNEASEIPKFDVRWNLQVGPKSFTEVANFDRQKLVPRSIARGRSEPGDDERWNAAWWSRSVWRHYG